MPSPGHELKATPDFTLANLAIPVSPTSSTVSQVTLVRLEFAWLMGHDSIVDRFYQQFGLRVRRARLDSGLNQEALGHRVGLERSSISNIEKGRQRVQLHMLAEFAAALDVTPAALLTDDGAAGDPLSQVPADARPFVHEVLKSARARARD